MIYFLFALFFGSGFVFASDVVVGILEDVPGHVENEPNHWAVRPIFQKKGDEWLAFQSDCGDEACLKTATESFPSSMLWTISFDGKKVGEVDSKTPKSYPYYASIGQMDIISKKIPFVGKRTFEFAGWAGEKVYRPLVALSKSNVADPDHWIRVNVNSQIKNQVITSFREKFPNVTNCKTATDEQESDWKYKNEDIQFVRNYRSSSNYYLIKTSLHEYRCGGPNDDPAYSASFVISPDGNAKYLASDIQLIDAGDYDETGSSEVLVMVEGYDLGGYRIYYDQFKNSKDFLFSFH